MFGCSTNNPILQRKIFLDWHLLDLHLSIHLAEPSPHNLLWSLMLLICEVHLEDELNKILSYAKYIIYLFCYYSYHYCEKPIWHCILVRKKAKQAVFRSPFLDPFSFEGKQYVNKYVWFSHLGCCQWYYCPSIIISGQYPKLIACRSMNKYFPHTHHQRPITSWLFLLN